MAEFYKYSELKQIFVDLTFLLRGLDKTNAEESSLVRLAYQLGSQPFQEVTDGVSYLWINYADTETNKQINEENVSINEEAISIRRSQLRKIDVHWIFYGNEDIQDIAYEFRNKIYSYKAKEYLAPYDIRLILDVPEAVLLFEEINSRWWARTELIVSYYLEAALIEKIPYITSTDVYLKTENTNLERTIYTE